MLRTIIAYGLVAGLIAGVPLTLLVVTQGGEPPENGMVIGYLLMLVALSTVFVAIKRRRDVEGGGVIRFWPAFGLGLAISAVAGVIYVIAWETGVAISGIDFAGQYTEMLIEQERAKGVSGAALQKFIADMEAFERQYADPLFRLPMTFAEIFPVGVLVSLVSAALLRNPRFLAARRAQAA